MKNLLSLFTVILLSSTLVFAQSPSSKIVVTVKGGKIKVNRSEISKDWLLSSFTKVLDTMSRNRDGYNKTHTYDELGIVLFESTTDKIPSGKVPEFQLYFDRVEPNNVIPTDFYEGKYIVENLVITRNTTIEELRTKLGYKESDSYMTNNYRFAKDGVYIYFQFNSDGKLGKASMGQDKSKG